MASNPPWMQRPVEHSGRGHQWGTHKDGVEDTLGLGRHRRDSPLGSSPRFSSPFHTTTAEPKLSLPGFDSTASLARFGAHTEKKANGSQSGSGRYAMHQLVERLCDRVQQHRLSTCMYAWFAHARERSRELRCSSRMAGMLERRDCVALLHQCLLKWQSAKAESRAIQVFVMRERLEKADAECCVLRRSQEEAHKELQHCQAQVDDGKSRLQWAEGELVRRSEQEFARLRELEAELAQLQAEGRTASADTRGHSSGSDAIHRSGVSRGAALGVTAAHLRASASLLVQLCWSSWAACISMLQVTAELLDQCAVADVVAQCSHAILVWRFAVYRVRARRASGGLLAKLSDRRAGRPASLLLHAWRAVACGAADEHGTALNGDLASEVAGSSSLPLPPMATLQSPLVEGSGSGRLTPPLPPRRDPVGQHDGQVAQVPQGGKVVLHCGPARFRQSGETRV